MTTYNTLQYPDPRLRLKAEQVADFGPETQTIVSNMFATLYHTPNAAGFAATQFNIQQQIIVIDLSVDRNQPLCLINPAIVAKSDAMTYEPEGCLSIPLEIPDPVPRAAKIKCCAYNDKNEQLEFECDGFLAKCIQHEMDHLNGILFIDYLSEAKRQDIDKALPALDKEVV